MVEAKTWQNMLLFLEKRNKIPIIGGGNELNFVQGLGQEMMKI